MQRTRRQFLAETAAAALMPGCFRFADAAGYARRSEMGIVTYSLALHQKATKGIGTGPDYSDPLGFLEACRQLQAGGMQFPFGERDPDYAARFRRQAERDAMQVEAILSLPGDRAGLERFEKHVISATQCGATVARVVMLPGRRYEQFQTRAEFDRACAEGFQSLQWAEPVAARHRLHLAVENHKDHLAAEKLDILRRISSQYVGMCVDVSNNFALCEDPLETARAFAPWAHTVHIKDHAIEECDEGFWLMDVALGEGFLPLEAIVRILRGAKPHVRFHLEVITRDPIKVPVRSPSYWATFLDRPRSAAEPMLRVAREKGASQPLPRVSQLEGAAQIELERHHVVQSLKYARETLGL